MPDGVVQWFDPTTGEAAIVRGGHVFPAAAADLEPVARHAGTHVHFDIRRDAGVERAVGVKLRPGARTSPRQGRFGTLAGARRPDTKGSAPFARPHPELGHALASHPLEVARAWSRCVADGDVDGALRFYAPDAVLHAGDDGFAGPSHLRTYLESGLLGTVDGNADVRGDGGLVLVRWPGVELRCRVEHGQVAEQWVGEAPPERGTVEIEGRVGAVSLTVATFGPVEDDEIAYAVDRMGAVLSHIDEPVPFARVKLTRAGDPAREKPAIAQVAVDVDGDLVRAHVAAHDLREVADLLQQRLRDKLEHRAEHRGALRTRSGLPEPGEWRHGDVPAVRPAYYDRPADERQLVRHKTFAVDEMTPDEAAFDMELLDYDFHLFHDLASGDVAVLDRGGDRTYHLTRLRPVAAAPVPTAIALHVDEDPPPELALPDAIRRLDDGGEPFVFFADATTGRGNLVYRRYDGHYGLITPGERRPGRVGGEG